MRLRAADKIRCDACPVMCYIKPGAAGACDRYANHNGELVRVDPHIVLERTVSHGGRLVPFQAVGDWDGKIVREPSVFVTAIGAGTTYPDYKPAPFIVSSEIDGVDMVTVVTEGIFSYCGVKVKIDTDRYLGPETATVRAQGEAVGHVTTSEYGSQMLSLGGVHHLTGGSKKEGRVTCDALMDLSNCKPVELTIDGGATVVVQAGYPPIVNGVPRSACGSAAARRPSACLPSSGMARSTRSWWSTTTSPASLSEHQAGKLLDIPDTGIKMKGRRSTPGRYFQVAEPGTGWGGTMISDPLSVLGPFDPKTARPGMTMLMVSTTGEHAAYYVLDEALRPIEKPMPADLRLSVERIQENCEPALCTVLFMGGAGGSLRAGVTDNPVRLTRSVKEALTRVTSGGAPVYVWPGGGITFMVDVTRLPAGAFGYVPTPALVAPIEFTLKLSDYAALGGHMDHVRPLASLKDNTEIRQMPSQPSAGTARMTRAPQIRFLADGRRLHLQDGPIDLIVEARGSEVTCVRLMTPRRGASPACSMNSATSCRCCAARPIRRAAGCKEKVARRMHAAVAPFAAEQFITPMAAVAGAVAEEILGAMVRRGAACARLRQQWRRHRAASGGRRTLHRRPDRIGRTSRSDADGGDPCRRSHPRDCDQRTPRPQFLARHCRRRDRAGADRGASRRRRHHHRQCSRFARTSRHRPPSGEGSAARQRSRRAAGHPRGRRIVSAVKSQRRSRPARLARASCSRPD